MSTVGHQNSINYNLPTALIDNFKRFTVPKLQHRSIQLQYIHSNCCLFQSKIAHADITILLSFDSKLAYISTDYHKCNEPCGQSSYVYYIYFYTGTH